MDPQQPSSTQERGGALPALALETTGVPNLDQVLGGGLPAGALVIVMGPPGSGKTTLANQMAFAGARRGRRALILTALSEPTSKLIAHLRRYRFFDADLVGDRVRFLSLQQFLNQGLEAISAEIIAAARGAQAGFVVLDGFRGVRGEATDLHQARQFLYDVGTTLSVQGTTTIIASEAYPQDPVFFPEMTTADVIIGLHFRLHGVRQYRGLEAVKVRAGPLLPGLHGLVLTDDGISVYPRLEARVIAAPAPVCTVLGAESESWAGGAPDQATWQPVPAPAEPGRLSFGLPELDALLNGGLTRQTSTLLIGNIGTGKTLLGLHFALEGVRAGEPALYLGFRETAAQLLQKADAFDLGPRMREALAQPGGLTLLRWEPVEMSPDVVAGQLLEVLERRSIGRLIVDSMAELERAIRESHDPGRVPNYVAALLAALRTAGVTSLMIKEMGRTGGSDAVFTSDTLSLVAENVLQLQQLQHRGRLHRVLSVLKMRYSAHEFALREYQIQPPGGMHILAPMESGADVLESLVEHLDQVVEGAAWAAPSSAHPPGRG